MVQSLVIALIAAFASLINLSVGMGHLRVSMGIIVMIVALHEKKELKPISTSVLAGFAVFLMRLIVTSVGGTISTNIALSYLLEVLFYIGYGVLYEFLERRDVEKYNNPLILILMICDFGANAIELASRYFILGDNLQNFTFPNLFIAAFVRSAIIWILIRIFNKNSLKDN